MLFLCLDKMIPEHLHPVLYEAGGRLGEDKDLFSLALKLAVNSASPLESVVPEGTEPAFQTPPEWPAHSKSSVSIC